MAAKENERMTIEQVAEALGVSKTTVSRALSGKGRISEKTRAKVFAYMGMPAQSLRLRKRTQRCAPTTSLWLCRSALLHWICRFAQMYGRHLYHG